MTEVTIPHLPRFQALERHQGHEPHIQIYPHKQVCDWEFTGKTQDTPEELQGLNCPQL